MDDLTFRELMREGEISLILMDGAADLTKEQLREVKEEAKKQSKEKLERMAMELSMSPGYQDFIMMPLISKIIGQSTKKTKDVKEDVDRKQKIKSKKDPSYTSVPSGTVRPVKVGDSSSDILTKMFNFMRKKYIEAEKEYKKEKKYRLKLTKIKEKRIEELITLFGGKYSKAAPQQKEESFLSKMLKYVIVGGALFFVGDKALAKINDKIREYMPEIPDFSDIFNFGEQPEKPTTPLGPVKSLSELVSRVESGGDYNNYNTGTAGVTGPPIKLSEMTVGQVMKLQKEKKIFAAGKYQMTPKTLKGAVNLGIISESEPFNPANQEKLFSEYLIGSKRPAIRRYLDSDKPTEEMKFDALRELSKEFAGLPDPKTGKSRYEGKAGNKAGATVAQTAEALEKSRLERKSNTASIPKEEPKTPELAQPEPKPVIPQKISQTNTGGGQNVSVLNNSVNVINGGTTYLVSEDKVSNQSPLYNKQYNYT